MVSGFGPKKGSPRRKKGVTDGSFCDDLAGRKGDGESEVDCETESGGERVVRGDSSCDDVAGREGDGKSGVDCETESGGEKGVDDFEGEPGGDGAEALRIGTV